MTLFFALSYKTAIFQYAYNSLIIILILSAPPIILASVIGLFVAIIQAATQIQEQTFAFAVKMVVVIGSILALGGWLGSTIQQFTVEIFSNFHKFTM